MAVIIIASATATASVDLLVHDIVYIHLTLRVCTT